MQKSEMKLVNVKIEDDKTCSIQVVPQMSGMWLKVNGLTPRQATAVESLVSWAFEAGRESAADELADIVIKFQRRD